MLITLVYLEIDHTLHWRSIKETHLEVWGQHAVDCQTFGVCLG